MEYYRVIQTDEGIYRITSSENVYMELLVGTQKALLIDTGYGFGPLKETVRSITDKPLFIVNSHGHVDHTCGNYQFDETVYIADADVDLMKRHNDPDFRARSVELAKHTVDYMTGQEFNGLPEAFDAQAYIAGDCGHYESLKEGDVFSLGGKTIRAIATPGHTKGSMSFFYEEKNWLFDGDAANIFLWLFGEDSARMDAYLKTLDRILTMAPEKVFGAHADQPYTMQDVEMFRKTAVEADYEKGVPFSTPIMPECDGVRICVQGDKTMADIGQPGFYAIVIDRENSERA